MGELMRSVLVVDDDQRLVATFARQLGPQGINVVAAYDASSALNLARKCQPQGAVLDLCLGPESGLMVLDQLVSELPAIRAVVLTGYPSVVTTAAAIRRGAVDVVSKPCSVSEVMQRLDKGWSPEPTDFETPSLDRAMWEHVQRVLADCDGNKSETARRLGRPRSWLRRCLSKPPPRR